MHSGTNECDRLKNTYAIIFSITTALNEPLLLHSYKFVLSLRDSKVYLS